MTKAHRLVSVLLGCMPAATAYSQEQFTNCTAAFLDNRIVVDTYSPEGQCILSENATGILTVCTADLSPTESIAKDTVSFMVAIRDKNSRTLLMYSKDTFKSLDIRKVLAKCRKGDHIVLLTLDSQYALPHHEILIQ